MKRSKENHINVDSYEEEERKENQSKKKTQNMNVFIVSWLPVRDALYRLTKPCGVR